MLFPRVQSTTALECQEGGVKILKMEGKLGQLLTFGGSIILWKCCPGSTKYSSVQWFPSLSAKLWVKTIVFSLFFPMSKLRLPTIFLARNSGFYVFLKNKTRWKEGIFSGDMHERWEQCSGSKNIHKAYFKENWALLFWNPKPHLAINLWLENQTWWYDNMKYQTKPKSPRYTQSLATFGDKWGTEKNPKIRSLQLTASIEV
jgi:hypothetical protein